MWKIQMLYLGRIHYVYRGRGTFFGGGGGGVLKVFEGKKGA